jgi:hypothetical protein
VGTKLEYRCEQCAYTAMVAGGEDVGMAAIYTVTAVCEQCCELVEVYIGTVQNKDLLADPESRKKLPVREQREYMSCPFCHRKVVATWEAGGACPKCQMPMTATGRQVCWD